MPPASGDPFASIHWDDTPIDWSKPLPVTPPDGVAQVGYVGATACKDCHASIYETYARHSMARTGMRPLASLDKKWLWAIFDAGAKREPVRHERSGYTYRPYREGERYFVEERITDANGKSVVSWTQRVEYALSAGSYGMAFYFRQGARFYQVPIDYYAKAERWDVDPGAVEGNPRWFKPLLTSCIHCHGDYPRARAASEDVFLDPLPAGVGCERCHGPGEKHVKTLKKEDIVNPARLSATRQLDVCAQCHQSTFSGLRADRTQLDYRPGEPLDAYRVNFVGEPAEADRVGLLAHPERMVRSKCFTASNGKLGCVTCHDPHKSAFDQPRAYWGQKCMSCHEQRGCIEEKTVRAKQGDDCVHCHMRAGPPMNPALVTITDHWIQRRPPPIRPGRDEHPQKLVPWSTFIGDPVSGDDMPAVQAIAYTELNATDDVVRLAASVVDHKPHTPQLWDWLAGRFLSQRQPVNAARARAVVLRYDTNSRDALLGYTRTMFDTGSRDSVAEGNRSLDRLLAIAPDDSAALELRGIFLFRIGKTSEAKPFFELSILAGPAAGPSRIGLAALALRAGNRDEAVTQLEAARKIEPSDPWILDKLADAYAKSNDTPHAEEIARARRHFAVDQGTKPSGASAWLPPAFR